MKRITRDDLLHRISTGSPYEAVIVAAREARRLNRTRIARQSLFPPLSAGLAGAGVDLPGGASAESLSDEDPLVILGEGNGGVSHDADSAGPEPVRSTVAEVKVTMQALERLAHGDVTYNIAEGPIEPEEE